MDKKKDLELSPPWDEYYKKILALFRHDKSIDIIFDDNSYTLSIIIDNNIAKAKAIRQLLPSKKEFGNITMKIDVYSNPKEELKNQGELLKDAFKDNPIVENIEVFDDVLRDNQIYVIFNNKVVQYFNDDICDIHGIRSTLYQDIAKEVFKEMKNVHYCTALSDDAGNVILSEKNIENLVDILFGDDK